MDRSDRGSVHVYRRNWFLSRQLLLVCGVLFLSGTTPRTAQGNEAAKRKATDAAPVAFAYPDAPAAVGDTLYSIDVENIGAPPVDAQLGVEFALDHFWVTGRSSADSTKRLYKLNRNGRLDTSFFQWTTSYFGWRDLAFDGTYLYASDENEFAKINPNTGQKVGTLPKPTGVTLLRGLAFDPVRRHFWTTDFSGPLIEFDSSGTIINSFATPDSAGYGLAWDQWTSGGPYLWMWAQKGPRNGPLCTAIQVNPLTGKATGVRFTGVDFQPDSLNDLAGGATISHDIDPSRVVFVGLHQSAPDRVVLYDLTSVLASPNLVSPLNGALNVATTLPLMWDPVAGGTAYRLQVATDSSFQKIFLDDSLITGTSHQLGPLADTVRYFWRVKAQSAGAIGDWSAVWNFRTGNSTAVSPEPEIPANFKLEQNYPNPFNPSTTIRYAVPHEGHVRLEVFNMLGGCVAVLVNERQTVGFHSVVFGSYALPSGVYYCRMIATDFSEVRALMLLK